MTKQRKYTRAKSTTVIYNGRDHQKGLKPDLIAPMDEMVVTLDVRSVSDSNERGMTNTFKKFKKYQLKTPVEKTTRSIT